LRNYKTPRDEFIFYADRLAVLLMEKWVFSSVSLSTCILILYSAVSCLPSEPVTVTTPVDATYQGLKFSQKVGAFTWKKMRFH
jgi:uridine kinase